MAIEWGTTGFRSDVHHVVLDNSGFGPANVLRARAPYTVEVRWQVPAPLLPFINPSDSFRVRLFAESIGPGPEEQVGPTLVVAGVAGQTDYVASVAVASNTLPGEGDSDGAAVVSGMYRITCVVQHLSAGGVTIAAGCSDDEPTVVFNSP